MKHQNHAFNPIPCTPSTSKCSKKKIKNMLVIIDIQFKFFVKQKSHESIFHSSTKFTNHGSNNTHKFSPCRYIGNR